MQLTLRLKSPTRRGTAQLTGSSGLKHVPHLELGTTATLLCLTTSKGPGPLIDTRLTCS